MKASLSCCAYTIYKQSHIVVAKNLKKENIILIYTCHKGIEGFLKYSYTFMWKMIPKSFLIFSNSIFFLYSTSKGEIKVFFFIIPIFWYFYDGRQAVTFMRQDILKLCVKNSCLTYVWLNVTQSFLVIVIISYKQPIKCWFYGKFTNFPFIDSRCQYFWKMVWILLEYT